MLRTAKKAVDKKIDQGKDYLDKRKESKESKKSKERKERKESKEIKEIKEGKEVKEKSREVLRNPIRKKKKSKKDTEVKAVNTNETLISEAASDSTNAQLSDSFSWGDEGEENSEEERARIAQITENLVARKINNNQPIATPTVQLTENEISLSIVIPLVQPTKQNNNSQPGSWPDDLPPTLTYKVVEPAILTNNTSPETAYNVNPPMFTNLQDELASVLKQRKLSVKANLKSNEKEKLEQTEKPLEISSKTEVPLVQQQNSTTQSVEAGLTTLVHEEKVISSEEKIVIRSEDIVTLSAGNLGNDGADVSAENAIGLDEVKPQQDTVKEEFATLVLDEKVTFSDEKIVTLSAGNLGNNGADISTGKSKFLDDVRLQQPQHIVLDVEDLGRQQLPQRAQAVMLEKPKAKVSKFSIFCCCGASSSGEEETQTLINNRSIQKV